ncbi:tight adherence protein B [Variovorax boronicumulans]|uniref:Tight adherence protein B n=1 Tax=Variovorax boronicumulans TaxID=436515 RepID=A0AAW8E819_9BURK|nr:type II secretion system F family protein [Variovorax boronicumulans]MDP9882423.1 tight adherence protein B [Variovorax boronicumulans]MDP9927729.1 tight adherence protein B [Variovorax boronicumulans]
MLESGLLGIAAAALLLAACGLFLWQWAKKRQTRHAVGRHLDQQIQASTAPSTPAAFSAMPPPRAAEPIGNLVSGLTTDPWLETEATAAAAARPKRWLERVMPGWLVGAVEPRLLALGIVIVVALSLLAGFFGGWLAAFGALFLLALAGTFTVWLRLQKMRRKLVGQLPGYIDAMVRLITIGNSTQAAFQLAIGSTQEPLHGHLERSAALVRAGVDLDKALHQTATNVRIEEMFLLSSILGLGVRYGGRADLLLERVSNFMRDREQAEHELVAMSSETRLSAWILGLLPVGVAAFMIMNNPSYFLGMWNDDTGRMLVLMGVGLQALGALLLYRLARIA